MKNETIKLKDHQIYYTPNTTNQVGYTQWFWVGDYFDQQNLDSGLVFLERQDAVDMAEVLR